MTVPTSGAEVSYKEMAAAYEKLAERIARKPIGYLPLTHCFSARQAYEAYDISRAVYEQIQRETAMQLQPSVTYLGWLKTHYNAPPGWTDTNGHLSLLHPDPKIRKATRLKVKEATVAWMKHNAQQYLQKHREQVAANAKAREEATK